MTTISNTGRSPTPNIKSPTSSSAPSARSSLSIDRPLPGQASTRRNRSALRDYYKLSSASTTTAASPAPQAAASEQQLHEYDRPDFNAEQYVENLLKNEGLAKIMRVESELLSDVRGLDGERKALVYDNYSKLIDATETIGRVREMLEVEALTGQKRNDQQDAIKKVLEGDKRDSMDGKGKLDALVGRVVELAEKTQSKSAREGGSSKPSKDTSEPSTSNKSIEKQKATVRWILATPSRLQSALDNGKTEAAQSDWDEVKPILDQWEHVAGAKELKNRCEALLAG